MDDWHLDASNEDTQAGTKKKVITIPLFFNSVDMPRGGAGGPRGGPRRGSGRPRDRPNRSDPSSRKSSNNILMYRVYDILFM